MGNEMDRVGADNTVAHTSIGEATDFVAVSLLPFGRIGAFDKVSVFKGRTRDGIDDGVAMCVVNRGAGHGHIVRGGLAGSSAVGPGGIPV